MFKISRLLTQNRKNVVKISFGTLLGQGISIIMLPIVARIYGPNIIGIFALIQSISVIINSFADLGMTHAIMIVDDNEKNELYRILSTLTLFLSILSALVVTLYFVVVPSIEINMIFFFVYLTLLTFTSKQVQTCYTLLNREGQYNILMKNPIINNISYTVVAIILGVSGFVSYGYYVSFLLGQMITLLHMKRHLPQNTFSFKYSSVKDMLKKQNNFVKFQTPANILSNIKNQLPIFLIKSFWGTEILGFYSLTVKLLKIPITLLANAIGRIFFNTVSVMKRKGQDIGGFVLNNLIKGMKIATIPIALLIAFSDVIIMLFFGKEWEVAGNFIRILAIQYFFMFLTVTVQGLPAVIGKQKYAMVINILQIITFTGAALIGKLFFNSIYISLVLMTTSFVTLNLAYYYSMLSVMGADKKKYIVSSIYSVISMILFALLLRITLDEIGVIDLIQKISQ